MGGSALLQRPLPLPFTLPQPKLSTGKGWAEVEQVVTSGKPAGGRLSAQAGLLEAGVRRPRWRVLNLALGNGINHQGPSYSSLPLAPPATPINVNELHPSAPSQLPRIRGESQSLGKLRLDCIRGSLPLSPSFL